VFQIVEQASLWLIRRGIRYCRRRAPRQAGKATRSITGCAKPESSNTGSRTQLEVLGNRGRVGKEPKFVLGELTALAMLGLSFLVPRGGAVDNAQLVQFPVTVGVWAIFVLLFVKLK
jgi:hypothetical protein